jgi:hypothetical protein
MMREATNFEILRFAQDDRGDSERSFVDLGTCEGQIHKCVAALASANVLSLISDP